MDGMKFLKGHKSLGSLLKDVMYLLERYIGTSIGTYRYVGR